MSLISGVILTAFLKNTLFWVQHIKPLKITSQRQIIIQYLIEK